MKKLSAILKGIKWLTIGVLALAFFFFGIGIGLKEINTRLDSKEYKYITINHCIRDAKCFWFAFKRYTNIADFGSSIKKWSGPIQYQLPLSGSIVNSGPGPQLIKVPIMREAVSNNLKKVASVFPYTVSEQDNINYLVVVTRSLTEVKNSAIKDLIVKVFTQETWNRLEKTLSDAGDSQTMSLITKDGRIIWHISFIKAGLETPGTDAPFFIMDTLGFSTVDSNMGEFQFDTPSNNGELNDLHLLLIKALYDEGIKPGMRYSEVKEAFPKIYAKILYEYEMEHKF